jgi:hypothetical protein
MDADPLSFWLRAAGQRAPDASKAREIGISAQLLGPMRWPTPLAKQGALRGGYADLTFFDSSSQDPTVRSFVERYKELS